MKHQNGFRSLVVLSCAAVVGRAMASPYVNVTPLHSFSNTPDGSGSMVNAEGGHPRASLLEGSDGKLYGTTWLDGPGMTVEKPNGGCYDHTTGSSANNCPGTIFSMSKNGANFAVVHGFSSIDSSGKNSDGNQPAAALTQGSDGWLYGTTTKGGSPSYSAGCGTAFKVQTNGSTFTQLHAFCNASGYSDGQNPYGSIIHNNDGYVYGATHQTGANKGTVFKLSTSCSSATDNSCLTGLHTFAGGSSDGATPYSSPIFGATNTLFGITGVGLPTNAYGGTQDRGVLYSLTSSGTFTLLHSFCSGSEPCATANVTTAADDSPLQTLIKASDGNFYGVAEFGGANGTGFVYRLTPSGALTVLYSFAAVSPQTPPPGFANSDGANPVGTLVEGRYGFLYGTTDYGGTYGTGGIFQISKNYDTDGQFTYLYSFDPATCISNSQCNSGTCSGNLCTASVGNYPWSGLIYASDGRFYGTCSQGGDNGYGAVFAMDQPGSIKAVYNATTSTVYTSDEITFAGVTGGASGNAISISGGTYSLNGGSFTSAAGTIHHNDTLRVRLTSSSSPNTRVLATITIAGMGNGSFGVTTAP